MPLRLHFLHPHLPDEQHDARRGHQNDESATANTRPTATPGRMVDEPIGPVALEDRSVEVAVPGLSQLTNERLTDELQEVVGTDAVSVPADRPHITEGAEPERSPSVVSVLSLHWLVVVFTLGMVFVIAAIVALGTGDWWILPIALLLHAAGTLAVVGIAIGMTRDVEHPSPTLAAAMTSEGVENPDHRFSKMVEEFRAPTAAASGEGQNERTVRAGQDAATAAAEQSRSMTPTEGPSRAVPGNGSAGSSWPARRS
jgi:hypothetical protein